MSKALNIVSFSGIRADSLGNYLVSLGLLAAVSQQWPAIRGCWRDGSFLLVGEGIERTSIESYLLNEWNPTAYVRWWENPYGEDRNSAKKKKPVEAIARARARQKIDTLRSLDATVITLNRPVLNPIFGNLAGKLGAKRDFSRVQMACLQFLNALRGKKLTLVGVTKDVASVLKRIGEDDNKASLISGWLLLTLFAEGCQDIPPIGGAGTWFVQANRTYNSGQDWYGDGEISPWSFLLAMEGAILLVGGVSRRLSAKARPYAVFPFVTEAAAPASEGEVGLARAEFWAPLWEHPAALSEIRALLERGLARIGQRAAKGPHEFAVAAMAAGVDAGVTTFARFILRQTTNGQYYEAIPKERVRVSQVQSQESKLLEPLLSGKRSWLDRLPFDNKPRGKFNGLRGPIEQAIVSVAAEPNDPEQWRELLLSLADSQGRIDRNKALRGQCRALPFLDQRWFEKCWPSPSPEILVARAVASTGIDTDMPLIVNVYGVACDKRGNPIFSGEQRPQRVVWHNGQPLRVLADVVERRLVDTTDKNAMSVLPFTATHVCSSETLAAFLSRAVDYDLIMRWIPPLSLIKWERRHADWQPTRDQTSQSSPNGTSLLLSLFRPLFYPFRLRIGNEKLFPNRLLPRAVTARRLLNLIRQESWDEAMQLARGRYLAVGRTTISPPSDIRADGELLAAALLLPLSENEIAAGLRRWLQPTSKTKSEERR